MSTRRRRGFSSNPRNARHRLLGLLAVLLLLGMLPAHAEPAPAARSNPAQPGWSQFLGSGSNTLRSAVSGPSTPGVRWVRDLAEPRPEEMAFAPEGFNSPNLDQAGFAPISANGMIVMYATNIAEPGLASHSMIGIEEATGNVVWEIKEASHTGQGPIAGASPGPSTNPTHCTPAVDSQGRLWTSQVTVRQEGTGYVIHESWLEAYNLQTGQAIPGTRFDLRQPACHRSGSLHIAGEGASERLILYGYPIGGPDRHDGFLAADADRSVQVLDISGVTPTEAWAYDADPGRPGGPALSLHLNLGLGALDCGVACSGWSWRAFGAAWSGG